MADLSTDLNVSPYYDDYDENKQYYKILFRPATAVQARELTQIQTLLQKQISRFGDSIYKDGTIVEGCNFSQYPGIEQIKFKDSDSTTIDFGILTINTDDVESSNVSFGATSYSLANSYLLVSNTTGLRAIVFRAIAGAESAVDVGSFETNRAYVMYLNSGNNAGVQVTRFNVSTSEQIDVYSSQQDKHGPLVGANRAGFAYTLASNSTVNGHSVGYGIHVGPGIIYQKGFFQKSLPTNIIIKEESANAAGIRVGFDTLEYIVQPAEDDSLYDNSIGSANYSAPGAHRLKLVPVPVHYDVSNTQVDVPVNFLPILEFDGGNGRPVVNRVAQSEFSRLGDLINKRTFEESGDYVVSPFQVDVSSHESNTQSFYYNVSPGIGYIDGNRVEFESTRKIEVPRAIDTTSANNGAITTNIGNYVLVKDLAGTFDIDGLQQITFYSANQEALSKNLSLSSPLGVAVGNANVRSVLHYSGTKGTPSATYLVYVYNVRMRTGLGTVPQFYANAKSIYATGTYGALFGDVVANTVDGKINLYEQENRTLIYPVGYPGVNRLTNSLGVNDTTVVYRKTLTGTLVQNAAAAGIKSYVQFTMPSPDLCFYGPGTLSSSLEDDVNITFAQDTTSANVINNGTIVTSNATTVTISSVTSFNGATPVGSGVKITGTGGSTYHSVESLIGSNQVVLAPTTAVSGTIQLQKFFKRGTHVNLSQSATNNTAVISSSRDTVTINLDLWPDSTSFVMNAQIPISRSSANPIPKIVNKSSQIKIDCSTAINTTTGPWDLGWSDVYKIANVHVGATYSDTNADRIDWFELDNGQQDNMYGHAKLKLKPQYNGVLTSASRLLVKMHHFTTNASSTAALFFSKDSYPIDDANTANTQAIATAEIPVYVTDKGDSYDLRNCIDFRPVLSNTAVLTTTTASATINPANGVATFVTVSGAPTSFDPDSNMTYNIEYYLPRQDILIINKTGTLSVKKGEPALDPKLPIINKSGLKIAEITVPPYPSLTFKEAE